MTDEEELDLPGPLKKLLEKVNPTDVFILAAGFWLGYGLHLRPGFDLPGLYLGLPDIRGIQVVDPVTGRLETQEQLEILIRAEEAWIEKQKEELAESIQFLKDNPQFTDPRLKEAIETRKQSILKAVQKVQARKKVLTSMNIGQGLEMALFVFAMTRPGFLIGAGSVIQGIGEIAPL